MTANFWMWNIKTKECLFSDEWCRNLGYEPSELIHHEETWLSLVHEESKPVVFDKLGPVLSGELDFYSCKYRLRHKNSSYIWHLDTGRVIERDNDGKATIMEGHDIQIAC